MNQTYLAAYYFQKVTACTKQRLCGDSKRFYDGDLTYRRMNCSQVQAVNFIVVAVVVLIAIAWCVNSKNKKDEMETGDGDDGKGDCDGDGSGEAIAGGDG